MGSFGVGAFLIPISISAIFKISNFRTALDVLSVLLGLNGAGFLTHAIRSKWGRKPSRRENEEEESHILLNNLEQG